MKHSSGVAVLALAVLVAGCASYRVASTGGQGREAVERPAGISFNIAAATFVSPTNVAFGGVPSFGAQPVSDAELRSRLMAAARNAYPGLFDEAPAAIPLNVTITRAAYDIQMGGDSCVSCLTLTILPLRSTDRTDYTVVVAAGGSDRPVGSPAYFSRMDTSWMSILPTGWIPVPGGQGDRCWGTDSAIEKGGALTLASCVDAIVEVLCRAPPQTWQALRSGAGVAPVPDPVAEPVPVPVAP